MLIDFHTHCFPEKIAAKAIEKLSFASGGQIPYTDGTLAGLKQSMDANGITASVVLNIATNAHQQASVNDFAVAMNNGHDIFGFGSVFPHAPDALEELERIKALGLKGVKLHPDYQGFPVDDLNMKPIYKKISELGLITVFHAGVDYGFAPPYGATPEKLAKALAWFDAPVVAAHWGGLGESAQVIKHLCGIEHLYFDTSFGYATLPRCHALQILEQHGIHRMLFGTDTPWHTPELEWRLLNTLNLTPKEQDAIAFENAKTLLQL